MMRPNAVCRMMCRPACLLTTGALLSAPLVGQADYHRADMIRVTQRQVLNLPDWLNLFGFGNPTWLEDSTRFWYRVRTVRGHEFILVDPVRPLRRPVFDNARLASAMSIAGDTTFDPVKLPFTTFKFLRNEQAIELRVGMKRYECDLAAYRCTKGDTLTTDTPAWAVLSPDKQWEAFSHKFNIYVRSAKGAKRDSIQITTDGAEENEYGLEARVDPQDKSPSRRPELWWSPDSKRIAVARIDERGVRKYPVYSSTDVHPKLFLYPVGTPGDSIVPTRELYVLTIAGRANVRVQAPPQVNASFGWTGGADAVQWSSKSDRIFFIHAARANKSGRLFWAEATTGATHIVAGDSLPTFTENSSGILSGNWRAVGDGHEVLWWSERDGWGHLYRFDDGGHLLNQITSGPWLVDRIKYVDPVGRQAYFQALGRDSTLPYYSHLVRVNFDGGGLTDLTPEPGNHLISFVPSGKYFLDVHSLLDTPPSVFLRAALDGRKLLTLEQADIAPLVAAGWTPPRLFKVKARDGVTDLYGLLHLPSHLDTTKKYPVINHVYPGPQVGTIFGWGWAAGGEPRALAELGFIVIQVNALGTPGRSKAFHDFYYGNMGDNGLPDQMAAMEQLAARYPFIDLSRAGIYGHSGGGFASTDAILKYPDFFKVAVSGSGNHDNRSYVYDWGEKYQGLLKRDSVTKKDNYDSQANYLLAGNLKGHLLLMTGDMDTNVHPTMTFRLVDALIKAEKDFDLVVIPDAGHGLPDYSIKRRWDYFVRWLLRQDPPRDYHMMKEP